MEFVIIVAVMVVAFCSAGSFIAIGILFNRINKIERKFIRKGIIDHE